MPEVIPVMEKSSTEKLKGKAKGVGRRGGSRIGMSESVARRKEL